MDAKQQDAIRDQFAAHKDAVWMFGFMELYKVSVTNSAAGCMVRLTVNGKRLAGSGATLTEAIRNLAEKLK